MSVEKMSPPINSFNYSSSSSSDNMSQHMSPPLNPRNITHYDYSSRNSLNSEENLIRTQNTSKKLSHFSEKAFSIKKILSQPSIPTGFKLDNLKGDEEKIDQITIELQPTALLSPDSNKGREETVNIENYRKKEQSPRKLHRNLTMKVPNNYFVSDNSSENDDRNFGEIIENDLNFNYKVFFQFFLMHSLFYFVLGPFSAIPIAIIWGGQLARNQFFWGFNSELIVQTFEYLIIFTVLFLYYFYNFANIFMIEIYMVMAAVFLRISIISIKYATMNEDKIKLMKTKDIPHEDLKSEFTLRHFREINDLELEKELQTTIIRKDIDVALLLFRFLGEVNSEIKSQIQSDYNPFQEQQKQLTIKSDKSEERKTISESTLIANSPSKRSLNGGSNNNFLTSSKVGKRVNLLNGVNIIDEDMKTVYSGYLLTQLIIKKGYQQGMKAKWFVLIGIIVSFTHAAIPSCYRLYSKGFLFGDELVERFLVIALFLINFYLFFMNFSFLLFGIFEFGRQLRSLNQLSHLMASKKLSQLEDEKFTPTIDFFCKLSLKSWGSLHKIIRSFGAKYKLRIECYLTLFSLFYLMITILIISAIFGNLETLYSFINLIILIYEVLIMSLCMIGLISIGVVINKQYQIHKGLIKTNKDILSDLLRLYIVYFEKKGYKPENEVYRKGVEKINQNVNYYLSNSISICNPKKWVHDELRKKVTKRVLKDLISICDEIIEELTFENLYEPFKINGIAATPKVLHSIFAIFGSLLFAVGQKYLKNYL